MRNADCNVFCKTTWPGGFVCLPKGAAAPDPRAYARVSGGAGAGAAPGGKCYGDNLAAAADIASTGSYFGDVGARSAAAS